MSDPPNLERGLRICNENLESERDRLIAACDRHLASADGWRLSWEKIVNDLGDLLQRVRQRPKGRRFATVLELNQVLTAQGDSDD